MTYLPAHQAQLGAGIPVPGRTRGSRDCGPRTVSMGIDKLTEGQVALGIGWSWGKGVLTFKGKAYPFKVDGITVGDVGITKAEAEGKVYNLKKLSDFDGSFTSAGAEGTLVVGAGATAMKNEMGVVVHLFPKTKGVNLKLAGGGVKFTLEKTK